MFKSNKRLKSIEFELVQLRMQISYQNDLWEKLAKKVGVKFPKYDIYKEYTDKLQRAMDDYELGLFNDTELMNSKLGASDEIK